MKFLFMTFALLSFALTQAAPTDHSDYLVKLSSQGLMQKAQLMTQLKAFSSEGMETEVSEVTEEWIRIQNVSLNQAQILDLSQNEAIEYIQPNYKLNTFQNLRLTAEQIQKIQQAGLASQNILRSASDNPNIPEPITPMFSNFDPLYNNQWGMVDNGVSEAWKLAGQAPIVVAVIDTGVDYTHEDLVESLWRNPFEIPENQIDDDNNGYVDDVIGWDFVSNDNKPYDLTTGLLQMLIGGGNAGHGTHCAGNIAARAYNGIGIAGIAGVNNVKIMSIRFLSERGQGTTADAVRSIRYAVDNGAHVLSNSWGSSGEDPNDPDNQALREAISYSQAHGVLFIAAAGNGDSQGRGYNNDTSSVPAYPASYPDEIIISVAALDKDNRLGSFSNWGKQSVDIGAPGVAVYSTVPMDGYTDTVLDLSWLGIKATWDGTSMATPHVSGAAALYWSRYPNASWLEVKNAILSSATPIPSLSDKLVTGGKLNVSGLMNQ